MRSSVKGLGAEHHGDISELLIEREYGDTDDLTIEIVTSTGEQMVTTLPADKHTRSIVVAGHLLPPGEAGLVVTSRPTSGRQSVSEHALTVPDGQSSLHRQVAASLRASSHPLLADKPVDSTDFDFADSALTPWFDRPDASAVIAARLARGEVSRERAAQLADFVTDGFIVIEDAVPDDLLTRLRGSMDHIVDSSFGGYSWGSSARVELAHMHYPAVDELTRLPAVVDLLRDIFGADPRVCQTLTYIFGSQQGSHQDTVHLTPFPAGYMCGVWVAVEDVRPGSGELRYYPGSHRLERVYLDSVGCPKVTDGNWTTFGETVVPRWHQMLADGGFRPESFLPRAGTVLIWHENLMHEGSQRTDPSLSRRSVVSHYFAAGPIAFYDSSGMPARFHHRPLLPDH